MSELKATIESRDGIYRVQTVSGGNITGSYNEVILWENKTAHSIFITFPHPDNPTTPIPLQSGNGQCIQSSKITRTILPNNDEDAKICQIEHGYYPYRVEIIGLSIYAEGPLSLSQILAPDKVDRYRKILEEYLEDNGLEWGGGCMDLVQAFVTGTSEEEEAAMKCLRELRKLLRPYQDDLPEDVRKVLRRIGRAMDNKPKIIVQ